MLCLHCEKGEWRGNHFEMDTKLTRLHTVLAWKAIASEPLKSLSFCGTQTYLTVLTNSAFLFHLSVYLRIQILQDTFSCHAYA
jgi:hypothetical protein